MKYGKKTLSILLSFILLMAVCSAGITASAGPAAGQPYPLKGLNPEESTVKPTLIISSETLDYDEALGNRVRNVTLTVRGAHHQYAPTGLHIQVDPRLKIITNVISGKTRYAQLGDAGEFLSWEQKGDGDNGFYVATAAAQDVGQDGVLWRFQVELPEEIDPAGDTFPIEIAYKTSPSAPDMFTNADKNEQGALMQAWVFTYGIKQGEIKVREAAPKTVSASANPAEGGTVTGGGSYTPGTEITLNAAPAAGYDFVNWTENGAVASTSADYTFAVTEDRDLVANFAIATYTVTFVDEDGEIVATRDYTVETAEIDEPAVPEKQGYAGAWEAYALTTGDITVKPVYTETHNSVCELCGQTHDISTVSGFFTDMLHDLIFIIIRLVRFFTYELFI